ncbi:MAG TPA: CBS domain-containing protein [Pyrinomonadaceae bacterium]|nr:CBS domain-containing protein [Pyrinomonadaceae bacterium]
MQVKDVMTADPTCCTADTSLTDVATMMVDNDCGEIPVVESNDNKKPVGVVTDRDIVCRIVAKGTNPLDKTAADCMTQPVVTVTPDTPVDECCRLMEAKLIRRVPVVDEQGTVCGIVALADIARLAQKNAAGEVIREVSEPGMSASASAR